jgi:hypothetical protein
VKPLIETHPELATEANGWDPSKKTFGSNEKVSWVCSKNKSHIWKASISNRARLGRGCPICANRMIKVGENDLATRSPHLISEADGWDPYKIISGSTKKLKWVCSSNKSHRWNASVRDRQKSKNGCPFCLNRVILSGENDLATTNPEIAKEAFGWDPTKFSFGSSKKVKWKCSVDPRHVWSSTISNRASSGRGCPFCTNTRVFKGFNDLSTTHPELAKEAYGWDPKTVIAGSNKKFAWMCSKDPSHRWNASPGKRTNLKNPTGCPICTSLELLVGFNDMATTHPELAKEANGWDPKTVIAGSNKPRSWICKKNKNHVWLARPSNRVFNGVGCPFCVGKKTLAGDNDLATTHPEIAKEAFGWDPRTLTAGSQKRMEWKCSKHGDHFWKSVVNTRTSGRIRGCPFCTNRLVKAGFNDLATTNPEIAMEAFGWDSKTVLAGTQKKMRFICPNKHQWIASVSSRKFSGCPTCSKGGFDPNEKAWLYFGEHKTLELLQIGITNKPKDRIRLHERYGWEIIEIRGPMDGHLTQQWETDILRMLRANSAIMGPKKSLIFKKQSREVDPTYLGTEIWLKESFPVSSIKELMELTEIYENKSVANLLQSKPKKGVN